MPEPSDEDLMRALRAGDQAAFEALYQRYRNRLYAFLVRYTGDPSAAQDLFQETFLRVFRDRARYEPRAAFATWLFTIARNLYLDSVKGAGIPRPAPGTEMAAEEAPDSQPDPLAALERREAEALLRRAVATLPEEDRAILILSRFEGMRYRQIGEILGCSEGAVKVRAHRALQTLRQMLRE